MADPQSASNWFTQNDPTAQASTAPPSSFFADNPPITKTTPTAPPPDVWSDLADDAKSAGKGALKATGRTAVNLLKVADWLFNGSHDQPFLDAVKAKIGEPTGTAENVGATAADIGEAFIPGGEIEAGAKGTEALAARYGGPLLGKVARVVTQGAAGAGTSAVQGGSPTVGGLAAGGSTAVGAAADTLAPLVKSSAAKTMIRALGPTGGRGPTSEANLASAEQLAPELVDQGFGAATQAGARTQAATRLQQAGADLKSVLGSPTASADFDQPALKQAIQARRNALLVNPGNGQPAFLPDGATATDNFYARLQSDVDQLGPNPTQRAVHDLKSQWNDLANFAQKNPAAGTEADVYEKGGDLIRASMAKDAAKLSQADQEFSKAVKLNDILNAPNVRRPGPGASMMLSPYAKPVVGATVGAGIGYHEGGEPGAVAGAVSGAALGALIQSPGFRYVSANLKGKLADALDSGDNAKISQAVAAVAGQVQAGNLFGGR